MKRFLNICGRTMLAIAAVLALSEQSGCRKESLQDAEQIDVHAGHERGEETKASPPASFEEIAQALCEHGIATYVCDECRYEIGVVKVPPDMLKSASSDQNGLFATEVVAQRFVTTSLDVTGEIQLNENAAVHVSPRISGIIERVYVDIGAKVKRGDLLFKINSVELSKILAAHGLNRSLTELSQKNYEREQLLMEQHISSEQDMIIARMEYEQHKTELAATEEELRVLGLTEKDYEAISGQNHGNGKNSLSVRASSDGTIIQKHAVMGELVEPGKDVMLLADLSSLWAWADIYEKDLPKLLAADDNPIQVRVFVKAFPEQAFAGSLDYIGATMDEKTRTVKVRATVMNQDGLLRPGMFCEIHVGLNRGEMALAVPKTALLTDEGKDFMFAFWKEDFYVRRAVRTGREYLDMVEVIEGLMLGDRIVTTGGFLLKSDVLREKMGAGCAD